MDVQVVEALEDDRTVIRRLLQLYHYDFSEFDGSDVNPHGEYLHRYEPGRHGVLAQGDPLPISGA